jgi:hypothetical protein
VHSRTSCEVLQKALFAVRTTCKCVSVCLCKWATVASGMPPSVGEVWCGER